MIETCFSCFVNGGSHHSSSALANEQVYMYLYFYTIPRTTTARESNAGASGNFFEDCKKDDVSVPLIFNIVHVSGQNRATDVVVVGRS